MNNAVKVLALSILMLALPVGAIARSGDHAVLRLEPIKNSGVTGLVVLKEHDGETRTLVVAHGLQPGGEYVSLYYNGDNHDCTLEDYDEDDVIGGEPYTANRGGVGHTRGSADEGLDEIGSVSVRRASDFRLLACADVHPSE